MSSHYNQAIDQFPQDLAAQQRKQQQAQQLFPFDFYYPTQNQEILAPHPDSFELDLDLSLAGEEPGSLQLLTVDSNPAFNYVRAEPFKQGPPSAFTVSSESAYDSISSHSESLYNSNYSQASYSTSDYSYPLDMDFERIRIDTLSDYGNVPQSTAAELEAAVEAAGFGLPPSPPFSVDSPARKRREAFSDYDPSYSQPSKMSHTSTSPASGHSEPEDKGDPRKKYRCNVCPRAFARAYNLKTHMATHDPNRPKPHICPHGSCGRSFSRKHDLGRHLISIHRDESGGDVPSATQRAQRGDAIGIQKGRRVWCDQCGKSSDGELECDCDA